MKKLLATMLCLLLAVGALPWAVTAEEAPEIVEAALPEAPEAEPSAEGPSEVPAEEAEAPAEEVSEAPAESDPEEALPEEPAPAEEAPEEELPAEEMPEASTEEVPAEPEEPVEEVGEVPPEGAPVEEIDAVDEGEEIAGEAGFAYPEGLLVSSDGKTVTGYAGSATTLVIPEGITAIYEWAFEDCITLTSITLPDSLTTIGVCAFWGCTGLTSVTIPKNVSTIGDSVFSKCKKLKSFTVASGNAKFSTKDGVLFNKDKTTLVCFPAAKATSYSIPSGATKIGSSAFYGCTKVTSVTIPNGVTTIEDEAFCDCEALTSLTIPASVTSIGWDVFYWCDSLKSINVDSANTAYCSKSGVLFNKSGTKLICFSGGNPATHYSVPDGVKVIGTSAFACCDHLQSVTLPDGVTTLEDSAFRDSNHLASVRVPASVTEIEEGVFDYCYPLVITGYAGSCIETYANENGIPFEAIVETPNVTSASADKTTTPAKQAVTFTVKTPKAAAYLTMYAENGTAAKTWPASGNSSVSGDTRTWTVQYAIASAGNRTLTFKASANGTDYGAGKSVSITVTAALLNVTSATAAETTVAAKAPVTFTVKTPKDAKYLAMFSEGGAKVKVWGCTNYSKVSGSTRIWTVSYSIANKGTRHLTFKCAKSTTYGEGKTVDLKVVAEQPAVTSASANKSTVAARETVTFTVKTPAAAKFVALYTESGAKVKVWGMSGNSTVSGDVRTWTIQYAIASKGERKLTFRTSTNGVYGAGKVVNITVN